jgi:glycolate oxidase iron-sulfur subunit
MSAAAGSGPASQTARSAFDAHHPPARELIDKCVHCGFCLPVCPTYVLWQEEMDSPRGRIYLMRMAADGAAEMNDKWVGHLDACLGCMACMTACPSGVDYGKLIEATRAQIERNYPRSAAARAYRRMILSTFTNPARLRALLLPAKVYQKLGLQALARKTGLLKLLPRRLRSMESLLPRLEKNAALPEVTPAQGVRRHRVGMLTGCVQSVFFSQVNAATARVLAAEGCEVVAPREQSCCGALPVHAGEEELALRMARRTIDAFERAKVETIIVNAAGCGSSMKEYGHLLRDDPKYAERAREFAAKCRDISEFLAAIEPRAPRNPVAMRVAFHDSCHLQHAQGIRSQPRALLSRIPQLELLEIAEPAVCCGSAGIYNLVQPDAAAELGDRKAGNIAALKPDAVASGNPGCLLQIRTALDRAGKRMPVFHTIELLDASIRGELPRLK